MVAGAAALLGLALVPLVGPNLASARGGGGPSTAPVAAATSPSDRDAAKDIAWREDYAAALREAQEKDRSVLLRFTASWCAPCRVMDARVFPDERVKSAIADRVVPVKIDADREESAEVAQRYGVGGIPTLILVDAGGKELARGGFMSAEQLVEFLRR